jgi:hypothetical protein
MTDFIDLFDHEYSSSGVVLLRGEIRRHRSSGAQYSLGIQPDSHSRRNFGEARLGEAIKISNAVGRLKAVRPDGNLFALRVSSAFAIGDLPSTRCNFSDNMVAFSRIPVPTD